ncbi:MAG TPA: DMT family transporter [Candidatus Saccharimonadales bacterium]|nr:DMT family transporter [Candidatus Saccharimonadales bacterium]
MRYGRYYGSAAVVTAALLWSVDGLLRRHHYTLPAPVIVFWEHTLGFLILLPVLAFTWRYFKQLTRKQWLSIVGVALLSGAAGTILYTAALGKVQYIPFSVVVLLQQLNPIFAITASALLLRERLTKRFTVLSVIALAGAYFATFPNVTINFATGTGTVVAALFAVGAAASWGISTAFSKYSLQGTSSFHVTAARFGIAPFFALLFAGFSGSAGAIGSITLNQFWYLLAITFSTGLVAILIYYYGLKRVKASRAAILELAWPASAVLVGYFWLHQSLTVTQAVGGLVLTGAIVMIARDTRDVSTPDKSPDKPKTRPAKTAAAAAK